MEGGLLGGGARRFDGMGQDGGFIGGGRSDVKRSAGFWIHSGLTWDEMMIIRRNWMRQDAVER